MKQYQLRGDHEKIYSWNTVCEAILVFVMVLIAYGYFSTERDANINSRLALVKAFVDEGRFEIDSYHTWSPTRYSFGPPPSQGGLPS